MINGLAERLKQQRTKCGLSQRAVAQKLQISPSIVSGYETGERTPSAEVLLALSYLYRCSTDYLLGRETAMPKQTLEVDGLQTEQIKLLAELVNTMRK